MNSTGYILNGIYYKAKPDLSRMANDRASTDKEYSHDRQREAHRFELIQPYKNGKPNPEFVENYPQESKQYGFIKE